MVLIYFIIKVLTTLVKSFEPSGYCTMASCPFTFHITNVFGFSHYVIVQFKLINFKLTNAISVVFKSNTERSYASFSTLTTTRLPTTVGIFLGMRYFIHVTDRRQTSTDQNIAKLLTRFSSYNFATAAERIFGIYSNTLEFVMNRFSCRREFFIKACDNVWRKKFFDHT